MVGIAGDDQQRRVRSVEIDVSLPGENATGRGGADGHPGWTQPVVDEFLHDRAADRMPDENWGSGQRLYLCLDVVDDGTERECAEAGWDVGPQFFGSSIMEGPGC